MQGCLAQGFSSGVPGHASSMEASQSPHPSPFLSSHGAGGWGQGRERGECRVDSPNTLAISCLRGWAQWPWGRCVLSLATVGRCVCRTGALRGIRLNKGPGASGGKRPSPCLNRRFPDPTAVPLGALVSCVNFVAVMARPFDLSVCPSLMVRAGGLRAMWDIACHRHGDAVGCFRMFWCLAELLCCVTSGCQICYLFIKFCLQYKGRPVKRVRPVATRQSRLV